MLANGVLKSCAPANEAEVERYIHYASIFRSAGEAMCLGIAQSRIWTIITDDRRAIRIAQQAGMTVASAPQLFHSWAAASHVPESVLGRILRDVPTLAQFKPYSGMPLASWWSVAASK